MTHRGEIPAKDCGRTEEEDGCPMTTVGHDEEGGMRVNHRGYHRPQAQVLPKTIGMMLSGTVFGKVL